MSLFLGDSERERNVVARAAPPLREFFWALVRKVEQRVGTPGLIGPGTTCAWWHCAAEYLTDAAMVWALRPTPPLAAWVRAAVLEVARRPLADWIGPDFRDHQCQP
ncbi:MAG TPA: heparinase, partial [Lacunisphaera sp.]|nr:heparinase [Lacunisphaera sp.]